MLAGLVAAAIAVAGSPAQADDLMSASLTTKPRPASMGGGHGCPDSLEGPGFGSGCSIISGTFTWQGSSYELTSIATAGNVLSIDISGDTSQGKLEPLILEVAGYKAYLQDINTNGSGSFDLRTQSGHSLPFVDAGIYTVRVYVGDITGSWGAATKTSGFAFYAWLGFDRYRVCGLQLEDFEVSGGRATHIGGDGAQGDTCSGGFLNGGISFLADGPGATVTWKVKANAVTVRNGGGANTEIVGGSVSYPADKPSAPTELTALPGDGQASLTWVQGHDGGSAITKHRYRQKKGNGSFGDWIEIPNSAAGGANESSYTVTGLSNGNWYYFQVLAETAEGRGDASGEASVRLGDLSATWCDTPEPSGSGLSFYCELTFSETVNGLSFDDFDVQTGSATNIQDPGGGLPITTGVVDSFTSGRITFINQVDGKVWGGEVRFRLKANAVTSVVGSKTNASTPWKSVTMPAAAPFGAPTGLTVHPAASSLNLSWTAPHDGGSDITHYDVVWKESGAADWPSENTQETPTGGTSHTITGLVDAREYTVRVRAVNSKGESDWSDTGTGTPNDFTVPEPPHPLHLYTGNGDNEIHVSWPTPARDGGAPITGFNVWVRDDGSFDETYTVSAPLTHYTVTCLDGGTEYTVQVQSINAAGPGKWSAWEKATPTGGRAGDGCGDGGGGDDGSSGGGGGGGGGDGGGDDGGDGGGDDSGSGGDDSGGGGDDGSGSGDDASGGGSGDDGGGGGDDGGDGDGGGGGDDGGGGGGDGGDGGGGGGGRHVPIANRPPTARYDKARTKEDTPAVVDVLANDTDPDGDDLRVESVSAATHGTTQITPDGGVLYTPPADYHGPDLFRYVVSDGSELTATAVVDVVVLPVNDAPAIAEAIPGQRLDEGGDAATVDLTPFFSDIEGGALAFSVSTSDPQVVTARVTGAVLTLVPVMHGAATVSVTAEDPGGLTATASFAASVDDRLVRAAVHGMLAAQARSHLASARMTLGRRVAAGGNERSRLRLMGRSVPLGKAEAYAAARQMLSGFAAGSSRQQGRSGAPGLGAPSMSGGQPSLAGRGPSGGLGPVGALAGFTGGGVDQWLRGTEFQLALGGGGEDDEAHEGRRWQVWGQGDVQAFDSPQSGGSGSLSTGYVGVDTWLSERWLAGVAAARSYGEGEWRAGDAGGALAMKLTAAHPYVRWSDGATSVWMTMGGGWGVVENVRETGRVGASDLSLLLGLAEVRRPLGSAGGAEFGVRADAAWAQLRTAAGDESVDAQTAAVHQTRAGADVSVPLQLAGLGLAPFGEVHLRGDGGAGQTGGGVEMVAGLRAVFGPVRIDAQGRMLALHSAAGYRERGAGVTLSVGNRQQEGLSLSVSPRWGTPGGGGALWQEQFYRGYSVDPAGERWALDTGGEYGMRLPSGGLLTWFGSFNHSPYGRSFAGGGRLGFGGR